MLQVFNTTRGDPVTHGRPLPRSSGNCGGEGAPALKVFVHVPSDLKLFKSTASYLQRIFGIFGGLLNQLISRILVKHIVKLDHESPRMGVNIVFCQTIVETSSIVIVIVHIYVHLGLYLWI